MYNMQKAYTNQGSFGEEKQFWKIGSVIYQDYYKGTIFKTRGTNRSMEQNKNQETHDHLIHVNGSILE